MDIVEKEEFQLILGQYSFKAKSWKRNSRSRTISGLLMKNLNQEGIQDMARDEGIKSRSDGEEVRVKYFSKIDIW